MTRSPEPDVQPCPSGENLSVPVVTAIPAGTDLLPIHAFSRWSAGSPAAFFVSRIQDAAGVVSISFHEGRSTAGEQHNHAS